MTSPTKLCTLLSLSGSGARPSLQVQDSHVAAQQSWPPTWMNSQRGHGRRLPDQDTGPSLTARLSLLQPQLIIKISFRVIVSRGYDKRVRNLQILQKQFFLQLFRDYKQKSQKNSSFAQSPLVMHLEAFVFLGPYRLSMQEAALIYPDWVGLRLF